MTLTEIKITAAFIGMLALLTLIKFTRVVRREMKRADDAYTSYVNQRKFGRD